MVETIEAVSKEQLIKLAERGLLFGEDDESEQVAYALRYWEEYNNYAEFVLEINDDSVGHVVGIYHFNDVANYDTAADDLTIYFRKSFFEGIKAILSA